jgi:hypothetical protein
VCLLAAAYASFVVQEVAAQDMEQWQGQLDSKLLFSMAHVHSADLAAAPASFFVQEVAAQDMEQWQGQLEAFKKQLHVEKQLRFRARHSSD